jgi:hypothetical protein
MYGQTTTTDTNCTINGNTANCTSTSTDDSAQRQARAAAQAEQDKANEQAGAAVGNAMGGLVGAAMRKHAIAKQYKAYCNQHPGEPWARRDAKGTVLDQGTCPGTLVVTKEELIEAHNASFRAEKVVGYAESSGDTFTIHSERASDMRFHMLLANQQVMGRYRAAGIKTIVYTNDSDQRFKYDLVADHVVTPDASVAPTATPAVALAATPSATTEEESSGNAGPSDTATKAAASNIPQSAPAALAPATATATADTTKHCVTDKSGHTVCLDQH